MPKLLLGRFRRNTRFVPLVYVSGLCILTKHDTRRSFPPFHEDYVTRHATLAEIAEEMLACPELWKEGEGSMTDRAIMQMRSCDLFGEFEYSLLKRWAISISVLENVIH